MKSEAFSSRLRWARFCASAIDSTTKPNVQSATPVHARRAARALPVMAAMPAAKVKVTQSP